MLTSWKKNKTSKIEPIDFRELDEEIQQKLRQRDKAEISLVNKIIIDPDRVKEIIEFDTLNHKDFFSLRSVDSNCNYRKLMEIILTLNNNDIEN